MSDNIRLLQLELPESEQKLFEQKKLNSRSYLRLNIENNKFYYFQLFGRCFLFRSLDASLMRDEGLLHSLIH